MPESLMEKPMVYGNRARLGVIVPPTNTANEAEWQALAPECVTIHSARMPLHTNTQTKEGLANLRADIVKHAHDLTQANVDVVAYGCTAGSMVTPVDSLPDFISDRCERKALTTAQAIVKALTALSVKRVAVGTPYYDTLNEHEREFLITNSFDVVSLHGLGYGENGVDEFRNIARIDSAKVVALAEQVNTDSADAILLSCTDLATLALIPELEARFGKPVISSNSATFWLALRLAGITDRVPLAGRLFEKQL